MTRDFARQNKFVAVDGLRLRYVEIGSGPVVLMLHGGSLGSSADVFQRNLSSFAEAGFRVVAFDQPGFGLSDAPANHSSAYRRDSIIGFMDSLGIERAALVGHSQSGGSAVQIGLRRPERVSHIVVLGTGSLLPPIVGTNAPEHSAAQHRLERRMAQSEPTLDDTRKLLEANLFHHELITPAELALRHAYSIGSRFEAFRARQEVPREEGVATAGKPPLYLRLPELRMPFLGVFGRQDRGQAFERATRLKALFPQLDIEIVENCKHLVPWDAAEAFVGLTIDFLRR